MDAYGFDAEFAHDVRRSNEATHKVLVGIAACEKERHFVVLGFGSIYDWLIKRHKFSESAAHRRVQASRLLALVPEEKFTRGDVNLTTLTQVETSVRKEEKRTGQRMSQEAKRELVSKIERKTSAQTEQLLATEFPEAKTSKDTLRTLNEDHSRLTTDLPAKTRAKLERLKELLGTQNSAEVLDEAFTALLAKLETKETAPRETAAKSVPKKLRRYIIQRAKTCEYVDPVTQQRCNSTHNLQVDHVIPKAKGGTNQLSNLRCLCRQHNMHAAERIFGREHMNTFRTVRSPAKPYRVLHGSRPKVSGVEKSVEPRGPNTLILGSSFTI